MTWMVLTTVNPKNQPKRLLIHSADVYNMLERNDKECDVYCTMFPTGVTVMHSFDDLFEGLIAATYQDIAEDGEEEEEDDEDM